MAIKTKNKTPTVAQLKKKADAAWSRYIRYRDGYYERGEWWSTCFTCGDTKPLSQMQCGHFVSRRVSSLRFSEQNTHAQCPSCNVFKHGEQYLYSLALDNKYGSGTAKRLMSQRFTTHKFTILELEDIINYANARVKEYEKTSHRL